MAWDTASTPTSSLASISRWRLQLLLIYWLIVSAILGAFSLTIYGLVARDRTRELDDHVQQLAMTAANSLEVVRHEYAELETEADYAGYLARQPDGSLPVVTFSQLMGKYRSDSVADVPPSPLAPSDQGIEWFDDQFRLLVKEGDLFPTAPLSPALSAPVPPQGQWVHQGDIRSFVLPVLLSLADGTSEQLGYVRAHESAQQLRRELRQFRQRLFAAAGVVLLLVAVSGLWVNRMSLRPVLASFKQLQQFTADASHELRNPLTAIRASVAVLQQHPERLQASDQDRLRAIFSATAQMGQLVDGLLLLARLDHLGREHLHCRPIALDEILEDLVDLYRDRAHQAGIHLSSQLSTSIELDADPIQLQRLFTNLLVNALQYTPRGGRVTVTLQEQGRWAIATVEDTGIGIDPMSLPRIFDRFWRAESSQNQRESGSGLGLAIAQAIAQSHGGEILVQSTPQRGSHFQVRLPQ